MPDFTPEFIAEQLELASKATPRPWTFTIQVNAVQVASVVTPIFFSGNDYLIQADVERAYMQAACNTHEDLLRAHMELLAERDRLKVENERLSRHEYELFLIGGNEMQEHQQDCPACIELILEGQCHS